MTFARALHAQIPICDLRRNRAIDHRCRGKLLRGQRRAAGTPLKAKVRRKCTSGALLLPQCMAAVALSASSRASPTSTDSLGYLNIKNQPMQFGRAWGHRAR